jgi:hypothetical protein
MGLYEQDPVYDKPIVGSIVGSILTPLSCGSIVGSILTPLGCLLICALTLYMLFQGNCMIFQGNLHQAPLFISLLNILKVSPQKVSPQNKYLSLAQELRADFLTKGPVVGKGVRRYSTYEHKGSFQRLCLLAAGVQRAYHSYMSRYGYIHRLGRIYCLSSHFRDFREDNKAT